MGKAQGVAIAGGTGLIGRAIARKAVEEGIGSVLSLGRSESCQFQDPRVHYQSYDLARGEGLSSLIRGYDSVVFCAGSPGGRGAFLSNAARAAFDANFLNSNLLRAAVEAGAKRLILIASATAYPSREGALRETDMRWDEDPPGVYSALGWTWRYLEKMARWLGEEAGIEVVVLRTANVFGPFSRFDPENSNFIPALVRKGVEGMDPFEVYGPPENSRDVLYVDHLAEAVVSLLKLPEVGVRTFNIGSGYPTTVGQVAEWALKYAGHSPASGIRYLESNYAAAAARFLDCRALVEFLGWKPPLSAETGIEKLVAWWREWKVDWSR